MIVNLRKGLQFLKFVIMFLALTVLLYYAVQWAERYIQPIHQYAEPRGGAVKAFKPMDFEQSMTPVERLKFFYWYGE